MPRRGRASWSGSSRARRASSWEVGPGDGRAGFSDTTPQIVGSGSAATEDGLTLVRVRGSLYVQLQSSSAAGNYARGAVGIGVTSVEGFAVGVTGVPTPITEQAAESWIWWENFVLESVTDAEAINTGGIGGYRIPIDTKAMRKLNVGDVVYCAVECSAVSGTITGTVALDTRALVLLP